jgi:hypothetical protein
MFVVLKWSVSVKCCQEILESERYYVIVIVKSACGWSPVYINKNMAQ